MVSVAAKTSHFHAPYTLFCRAPPPHSPKLQLSQISFPRSKLRYLKFQSHFREPIFASPPPARLSSRPGLKPILCGNSSNTLGAEKKSWIEAVGEAVSTAFPVWVALGCLVGLLRPSSFSWVQPKWTVMGITITMLGMGMTLTFDDLRGALAMPKELLAGFVLQYSVVFLVFVFEMWCQIFNVMFKM